MNKVLIVLPKLNSHGGVSAYWNSILPVLKKNDDIYIDILEIGGHGKNIFGFFMDQYKLFKKIKNNNHNLVLINPSLGKKSFFRDALFAKQLIKSKTKFFSFFHGWDKNFEEVITKKYKSFFVNTFGYSEYIFVLSKDFKDCIRKWGYDKNIIVETTSIDSSLIKNFSLEKRKTYLVNSKKQKILFLARLLKEKGIYELVLAFINVSAKIDNVELIIAGSGKIESELKKFTANYENIKYTGHVENEEKILLFSEAYAYCLPSYSEGLPTSVLEAMAFALPVITTPVGGLKEFFQNEKMGYFVKPKNVEDIEKKLELLILNKNKVLEMSEFNYNFATDKLLNTVVAKRIYQYMEEVINE